MILHRPVWYTIACTYPLHPWDDYLGTAGHKVRLGIPDDEPVVLIPQFVEYPQGEWWWCKRCRQRDTRRRAIMRRPRTGGVPGTRRVVFGRWFITLTAQTRFARRHGPPGMAWCPYGLHYAPLDDGATAPKWRDQGYCAACYRLSYLQRRQRQRRRYRLHTQEAQQQFAALVQQRAALRREIVALRKLKRALEEEIIQVRLTSVPPDAIELDPMPGPARAPQRRPKGYRYAW